MEKRVLDLRYTIATEEERMLTKQGHLLRFAQFKQSENCALSEPAVRTNLPTVTADLTYKHRSHICSISTGSEKSLQLSTFRSQADPLSTSKTLEKLKYLALPVVNYMDE
jgi:hypothetical protein